MVVFHGPIKEHKLTYISLMCRWSLIIGLGVVALFMAVSWIFAPKGETQTYVKPFSFIVEHWWEVRRTKRIWKTTGRQTQGCGTALQRRQKKKRQSKSMIGEKHVRSL